MKNILLEEITKALDNFESDAFSDISDKIDPKTLPRSVYDEIMSSYSTTFLQKLSPDARDYFFILTNYNGLPQA